MGVWGGGGGIHEACPQGHTTRRGLRVTVLTCEVGCGTRYCRLATGLKPVEPYFRSFFLKIRSRAVIPHLIVLIFNK